MDHPPLPSPGPSRALSLINTLYHSYSVIVMVLVISFLSRLLPVDAKTGTDCDNYLKLGGNFLHEVSSAFTSWNQIVALHHIEAHG